MPFRRISRLYLHEILRFGIVGVVAISIHYGIYYILLNYLSANVAFTIGYFVSLLFNYFLTTYFTFKTYPTISRFIKFCVSHGVNFVIQIGLFNLFLYIGLSEELSPLPVYAISVPISFLLVRLAIKSKGSIISKKRNGEGFNKV